jgi:hypothetical protein
MDYMPSCHSTFGLNLQFLKRLNSQFVCYIVIRDPLATNSDIRRLCLHGKPSKRNLVSFLSRNPLEERRVARFIQVQLLLET